MALTGNGRHGVKGRIGFLIVAGLGAGWLSLLPSARESGALAASGTAIARAARDEALECVLVRSGQEPVVVNLDIDMVEQPEEVLWTDPIHR